MITPHPGEKWRNKASGDRVKVIKLLAGEVEVMDIDGANHGKHFNIPNRKFNNVDYIKV